MATVLEVLLRGLDYHRAGRRQEAGALYRQVLEADPGNADALHLMGMLLADSGDLAAAERWVRRAIAACPSVAMFHNNLGNILRAAGKAAEAEDCYRRAIELEPAYAEAYSNLGNVLQETGRLKEALAHYDHALRLQPECAEAHNSRGNALRLCGRRQEAVEAIEKALALRPEYAEAWVNLAAVRRELGQLESAEAACRRALQLNPQLAEAHANLGAILLERNRLVEAERACRRAISLKPELAEAYANLAAALIEQGRLAEAVAPCQEALRRSPALPEALANFGDVWAWQGQFEQALAYYERALALRPRSAALHNKRGYALEYLGRIEQALSCYEQAVALDPEFAEAHTNRAMTWLRLGDFERGWPEYEWRFRRKDFAVKEHPWPRWDGQPLEGRRLLVCAEQGLGDAIQFVRYLPLLEQQGATVFFEGPPRLAPLLEPRWTQKPEHGVDFQVSLLSLPYRLGTKLASIPASVPYLRVAPEPLARSREKFRNENRYKVGLVWAGNPDHRHDRLRSLAVEQLEPLLETPGVAFYSLQRGWRTPAGLPIEALEQEAGTLADTAADVLQLDLVISVDTMVAHLAGALGRPVWVLLSFLPDWRWMLDREDSPWYPTMRLFRQRRPGDWSEVIRRVAEALRAEVG